MPDVIVYERMLHDLEFQQQKLQNELDKVEEAIATLQELIHLKPPTEIVSVYVTPAPEITANTFADMSVRWAVLKYLFTSRQPMKTADIADALDKGGNPRASKTTVSAVVSDMVNNRHELMSADDGYKLTDTGKAVWTAIERSSRYRNRAQASPIES
jgi:hypothetical protein